MQGDGGCAKGRPGGGGSGSTPRGHLTRPWQEELWLFGPLLSAAPSTRRGRDGGLTECQSGEQGGEVPLRACTPPGRLLRPPCYHSYRATSSFPRSSRAEACVWYLAIPKANMRPLGA